VLHGVEMVNRGLKSLDELDEAECAELEAVIDVQAIGGVDVIDWNVVYEELSEEMPVLVLES
jgi:hypothetical protein